MENKINVGKGVKDSTPKKQKVSASYTLRALKENIRKLEELKLLKEDEVKEMQEAHKNAVMRYMGISMEI